MKQLSLIASEIAEAMSSLTKKEQDYIIAFGEKFLTPLQTLKRFFRNDVYIGKTADGSDSFIHRVGDLYILYADFVHNGSRIFLIFNVFKKEMRSIKPDPGDPYEKIISKVSH